MNKGLFVTGTGTGVGKTFISSLLCEALDADYWKPVQCGDPDARDSMSVKASASGKFNIIKERYVFQAPESPHYASQLEGIRISVSDFLFPTSDNLIIVEGAGGVLVPLNEEETMMDLAKSLQLPVILVAGYYLGAINHTMLSLDCLITNNMTPPLVFFNRDWPGFASSVIRNKYKSVYFFEIPEFQTYNSEKRLETIFHIREELSFLVK